MQLVKKACKDYLEGYISKEEFQGDLLLQIARLDDPADLNDLAMILSHVELVNVTKSKPSRGITVLYNCPVDSVGGRKAWCSGEHHLTDTFDLYDWIKDKVETQQALLISDIRYLD